MFVTIIVLKRVKIPFGFQEGTIEIFQARIFS